MREFSGVGFSSLRGYAHSKILAKMKRKVKNQKGMTATENMVGRDGSGFLDDREKLYIGGIEVGRGMQCRFERTS
jgi:hypothetical protein